ncbi:hypothetical protein M747DRAFT_109935 [Aspergillus niger ATCC 13496]|uniref:Uncharacterized protein n=1 Tax=Aspergillus niger ATCC 13496 TaxID=1353008 RepID=A0A370BT95_ASPNG|nr:hypothetical protein M747DRAFT_109935 [Aspergillus niger ATCC 13496]
MQPRPKRCRRICIAAAAVSPRKMDGELHTGWPCSRQRQSGDPPCSNSRSVRDCPRPIITVHVSVSVSTETLQCGEKGICRLWVGTIEFEASSAHRHTYNRAVRLSIRSSVTHDLLLVLI